MIDRNENFSIWESLDNQGDTVIELCIFLWTSNKSVQCQVLTKQIVVFVCANQILIVVLLMLSYNMYINNAVYAQLYNMKKAMYMNLFSVAV